jgi:hypothetical protein
VSALLCSTCSPCGAEDLRDYSAGFEKLRQLGLPDVSTGTYVNLEAYIPDSNSLDIDDLELGGNSWLLREDKAAASEFVHGHVRRIQVYDPKILRKIVEKELEELPAKERRSAAARNSYGGSSGRIGGTWTAAPVVVSTSRSQAGIILLLVFAAVLGSLIALGFKRATQ